MHFLRVFEVKNILTLIIIILVYPPYCSRGVNITMLKKSKNKGKNKPLVAEILQLQTHMRVLLLVK